jgi:hypothetical protein
MPQIYTINAENGNSGGQKVLIIDIIRIYPNNHRLKIAFLIKTSKKSWQ